jgi:hypothetical protein
MIVALLIAAGLVRRSYCNSCRARSLFPVMVPLPIFQLLHMWSLLSDLTRVLLHQLLLSSRTGWLNTSTNREQNQTISFILSPKYSLELLLIIVVLLLYV